MWTYTRWYTDVGVATRECRKNSSYIYSQFTISDEQSCSQFEPTHNSVCYITSLCFISNKYAWEILKKISV